LKTHVLLVEDDPQMAGFVKEILSKKGYRVSAEGSAEEGLAFLARETPDVLITDIKLPGLSGYKFCELLKSRAATASLPIIMLTVLEEEAELVKGLNFGADDYVTKPFSPKELAARVEALLRRVRHQGNTAPTLAVKELVVDLENHEARLLGQRVPLTRTEYEILVFLMRGGGKIYSIASLSASLWGPEAAPTAVTVKTHIENLRAKLGTYGAVIKTVKGVGYQLNREF